MTVPHRGATVIITHPAGETADHIAASLWSEVRCGVGSEISRTQTKPLACKRSSSIRFTCFPVRHTRRFIYCICLTWLAIPLESAPSL